MNGFNFSKTCFVVNTNFYLAYSNASNSQLLHYQGLLL